MPEVVAKVALLPVIVSAGLAKYAARLTTVLRLAGIVIDVAIGDDAELVAGVVIVAAEVDGAIIVTLRVIV